MDQLGKTTINASFVKRKIMSDARVMLTKNNELKLNVLPSHRSKLET